MAFACCIAARKLSRPARGPSPTMTRRFLRWRTLLHHRRRIALSFRAMLVQIEMPPRRASHRGSAVYGRAGEHASIRQSSISPRPNDRGDGADEDCARCKTACLSLARTAFMDLSPEFLMTFSWISSQGFSFGLSSRRIGRKIQKPDVVGNDKRTGAMVGRAVERGPRSVACCRHRSGRAARRRSSRCARRRRACAAVGAETARSAKWMAGSLAKSIVYDRRAFVVPVKEAANLDHLRSKFVGSSNWKIDPLSIARRPACQEDTFTPLKRHVN